MLQSLLFASLLVSGVGMPLVLTCEDNAIQEKVEFKQDNKKFVSYNDNDYEITLNVDELTEYTFNNLMNVYSDLQESHFVYNNSNFS